MRDEWRFGEVDRRKSDLPSRWSDCDFALMYVVDLTPSPTEIFLFLSAATVLSTYINKLWNCSAVKYGTFHMNQR